MTRFVVIPTLNSGARLLETVQAACAARRPVRVVVDGSTDGSDASLPEGDGLRVLRRAQNGGKGAAGFTNALVMDADGQRPAPQIRRFMAASQARPEAMVLGVPQFGPDAPNAAGRRAPPLELVLLAAMQARLVAGAVARLPSAAWRAAATLRTRLR